MSTNHPVQPVYPQYLTGGGEMGQLTRDYNWSANLLGSPENWSQSLLTTISIILNSRFPMFLWWGPELIQFYNDAYRPSLGNNGKHPSALGQKGAECWPEIWPVIKPLIDQVMAGGDSTWSEDQLIPIYRNNKLEDVYWTFSYSRVNDESGKPAGVLVICNETTEKIYALQTLQKAKLEIEQAQAESEAQRDTLESALQAAELGTFDMDLEKGTMEWNDRCRNLFGISHREPVDYEKDFIGGLHPDDRERILNVIGKSYNKSESNGDYDVEYRTIGAEDQNLRWIRAKGKVYFDVHDRAQRFVGAVLDITEQKMDEFRKNDFIGMVSHELKTPLTSINAYIQMLRAKMKKTEDEMMVSFLDKMNAQIKKMTGMVNGFLNISRLESGKIHLDKQSCFLDELVKNVVAESEFTASGHHIELICNEPIPIYADQEKISAVISNLLSNSVKYSPKGKTIEVKCMLMDATAHFSIKDEGMGIKPQNIEKLFTRFYRIETKHTQNISGFGIGLYLCAEIIQHHEGKIWVESESAKGSTFYFSLPAAQEVSLTSTAQLA
eukprot:gene11151-12991_t